MSRMNARAPWWLALALGCAVGWPALAQAPAPAAQDQAAAADPSSVVVATVDGEAITLQDLLSAKQTLPPQYRDAPLQALYANLLDQAVERRIIANAAIAAGVDRDAQVQRSLARAREQVLLESYITREVKPQLTEEKLQERYQREFVAPGGEEEVRARHILVKEQADAESIHRQISEGADFVEMAKQHSTGPAGPRGGDLGFFRRQDMVPEFSEAAFALQPGEVSAPVKTQFGWHVIKVEERRTTPPPPFEQVAEALQRDLAREIVVALVADLRAKAEVRTFNADGSPIVGPQPVQPAK